MRTELLDYLRVPDTQESFTLNADSAGGDITSGELVASSDTYQILRGIPRFLTAKELKNQEQTQESFSYKWNRADSFYTESREKIDDKTFDFMVETEPERYGLGDISQMRQHYQSTDSILEVGCGSGHYTSLYMTPSYRGKYVGVDLSAGIDIAKERHADVERADFIQANLFNLTLKERAFDIVHCRGVMHHAPSTIDAFRAVSKFVKPGGEFIFLIYRKNGPVREFTDDLIRETIKDEPADEAWEKLMQLTQFGKALSELNVEVDILVDVELLGIKAGKYDIQRLIYNHFVKAFWKPEWSDDENNIISFDWYHPQYVFRHTKEEVEEWCSEEGFEIENFNERWVGFTVRARKIA